MRELPFAAGVYCGLTGSRRDLRQGFIQVLGRHGLAVEICVAQFAEQIENSLALMRERDDATGLPLDSAGSPESLEHVTQIIPVDALSLPSEGGELAVHRVEVAGLL